MSNFAQQLAVLAKLTLVSVWAETTSSTTGLINVIVHFGPPLISNWFINLSYDFWSSDSGVVVF